MGEEKINPLLIRMVAALESNLILGIKSYGPVVKESLMADCMVRFPDWQLGKHAGYVFLHALNFRRRRNGREGIEA